MWPVRSTEGTITTERRRGSMAYGLGTVLLVVLLVLLLLYLL
jgi:hypothetical protein